MVAPHSLRQRALVDAILEERRDDVFALMLTDPLVAPLGPDRARSMFEEMTAATAHCLPRKLAA
jgi:alpha-galactosidase